MSEIEKKVLRAAITIFVSFVTALITSLTLINR